MKHTAPWKPFFLIESMQDALLFSFSPLPSFTINCTLRSGMKIIVLLNSAAGVSQRGGARGDELTIHSAFGTLGAAVEMRAVAGEKLTEMARELAEEVKGEGVIVAAGGDGTQSAVAAALAGGVTPMGVLPMGTLNHFAKDLGIPLDLHAAARVIVTGRARAVDTAQINERVFVNNSSIGLYPHVVRHRDELCERLGHGKWYAMLVAIIVIFRRFPTVNIRMSINGENHLTTTPFVFVGNNQYQVDGLDVGQRATLEGGGLSVYFANRTGRMGMLRLALRSLMGRLRQDRDFRAMRGTELFIDSAKRELNVAIDGEVLRFKPPLHYRTLPRSLRVMLPVQ